MAKMTLKVMANDLLFKYQPRVSNLVIQAQICHELLCRQGKDYGWTDSRRQLQYPFGLQGQGVLIVTSPRANDWMSLREFPTWFQPIWSKSGLILIISFLFTKIGPKVVNLWKKDAMLIYQFFPESMTTSEYYLPTRKINGKYIVTKL